MASKVFIDANLLIDFTLQRENYIPAREIIQKAIDGTVQLYTSPAVLHIVAYWMTKKYGIVKTRELILVLLNDIELIDCNHTTAVTAINNNFDDIEDALQYFTALTHGVDYFISSDKKLKKVAIPQLPIYTAKEFLAEFASTD